MNKEEKSKDYAELKVKQYDKNNTIEKYGMYRAMQQFNFDGYELQDAFETGWDEALKSQWIKVEEKLPEIEQDVLAVIKHNSKFLIIKLKYFGKKDWYMGDYKIIALMPIPPFDNILEDNKDVLKRLKDK